MRIYDTSDVLVSDSDIVYSVDGESNQIITITASTALLASFIGGFKYGSDTDSDAGGIVTWYDFTDDPIETVEYEVTEGLLSDGVTNVFLLNGIRNPTIEFRKNRLYRFTNLVGDVAPIRFIDNAASLQANVEVEILTVGITVTDGATTSEVVLVDPATIAASGKKAESYQAFTQSGYGNTISNTNLATIGTYNVNTVGAGTGNPLAAGETDFVYLQVGVTGESTVGDVVPELKIEYDEN
jgi:hypothetical protein